MGISLFHNGSLPESVKCKPIGDEKRMFLVLERPDGATKQVMLNGRTARDVHGWITASKAEPAKA